MHCTHPTFTHTQLHLLCIMEYIQICTHTYVHTYIQTYMHTYTYIHTHIQTYIHTYKHTYERTCISQTFCLTRSSFGCAFRWLPLPLCLTLCSLSLSVCSSVRLSLRVVPSRFALLLSRLSLSLSLAQRNVPNWFIIQAKNIYTHKSTHTQTHWQ